ncbi:MAG: polyprenyl synthetase family protein [Candidatus Marinamargulisbacteria bacterium]
MLELAALKSLIKDDLKGVNELINTTLASNIEKLNEIYTFLDESKGKQIRAALIILIGKTQLNANNIQHLAASIELMHLASLVHDDIIDEAEFRRNQACVYQKFGLNNGIIIGVHLYSAALKLATTIGQVDIVTAISDAVTALCEGEFIQVNERHNFNLTFDDYWTIVSKKTSSLFACSCLTGAMLGGYSEEDQQTLKTFGYLIGDIFQLSDDYLDIYDTKNKLSKKVDQDFVTGDISLPMIIAGQATQSSNSAEIKDYLVNNGDLISKEIKQIIESKIRETKLTLSKLSSQSTVSQLTQLLTFLENRIN